MRHSASPTFWKCFDALPDHIQVLARKNLKFLKHDPEHPYPHFKAIGRFHFMRVSSSFRVLGVSVDDGVVWFWIGGHDEYERLIRR
jgi:hypothetical protein